MNPILIVGAGICGLSLGDLLRRELKYFRLIEKSTSVGGRLATRRSGQAVFDHGAQFYKHSSERSVFWHDQILGQGRAQLWFKDQAGTAHFCGTQGMTQVAKSLAESSGSIAFRERVLAIHRSPEELLVVCESGVQYKASKVVLTCPLPQSLEILKNSSLAYAKELDEIKYAKALVGLFEGQGPGDFEGPAILYPGGAIFSIADNQQKKISPEPSFTVVMNPDFSEENFEEPEEKVLQLIEAHFLELNKGLFAPTTRQLKKWRYSHPIKKYHQNYYQVSDCPEIILGGDAFGGGSIYGAVRSAEAVLELL